MFADRTDGGEALAELLARRGVTADIVLAIPRGGLPVGRAVADRLDAPLDIVVARKIGAPWNPELALGAVASTGGVWLNDELIARTGVEDAYLERTIEDERAAAQAKVDRYRETGGLPDLADRRVVVVDDGVATGATAIACLRQIAEAGAAHVTLAAPVVAPDTLDRLHREADEVVAVETPAEFGAVGRFYRAFDQVSDEEAKTYLAE